MPQCGPMTKSQSPDRLSQIPIGRPSVDTEETSASLACASCFLIVSWGAQPGTLIGLCIYLTWAGLQAKLFPKLYLAVSPSSLHQDLGSPVPSTQTRWAQWCLSCCPYCLLWVLQSPRTLKTVSWEPGAGYGEECRGGNVWDRWAGRGPQMKPGFPVYSRNGCLRLSATSAHTLPEAFREPLDSC